jgi:hypothetical protein
VAQNWWHVPTSNQKTPKAPKAATQAARFTAFEAAQKGQNSTDKQRQHKGFRP